MNARRVADILAFDTHTVTVAAAWLPPLLYAARRGSTGHVAFVCPFCCNVHLHGTGGGFGGGDGHALPHCPCEYCRRRPRMIFRKPFTACRANKLPPDVQAVLSQLAPDWQFNLTETADPDRAGDFPRHLQKRLASRAAPDTETP
jgi:hypothetical protein